MFCFPRAARRKRNQDITMIFVAVLPRLATKFYSSAPRYASNNLSPAPAPMIKTEGVVSLEDMLKTGSMVCDFGAISPTQREGLANRVLKETFSEMTDLFTKLLRDPGDFRLKILFSVAGSTLLW